MKDKAKLILICSLLAAVISGVAVFIYHHFYISIHLGGGAAKGKGKK